MALLIGFFVFVFVIIGFVLINKVYRDIERLEGRIKEDKNKSFREKLHMMMTVGL